MMVNKKSQANFQFIAKNPPALLIAGGILMSILGDKDLGTFLVLLGVLLQILWLSRFRLF